MATEPQTTDNSPWLSGDTASTVAEQLGMDSKLDISWLVARKRIIGLSLFVEAKSC